MGLGVGIRRVLLVIMATVLALTATGCTDQGGSDENHLTVGASAAPNSMDPTTNSAVAITRVLLYNVYETLVKLDSSGQIKPLLASEWTMSTDRTLYTFKLRAGAKFASGAALDADAVVKSIERIQNNERVVPVYKAQMSVVEKVTAVNPTTVEVKLSTPSNNWLYFMAQGMGVIIDPSAAEDSLASMPAGSGPYQLAEWRQGESVELQANSHYWATAPRYESVTFRYFADANAMNSAMLAGDLDIISNVAAPQSLTQFQDSRFQIIEGTTNGEVMLAMNNSRPALSDVRVRQAINYALDQENLLDTVWAGKGTLISSMVPPTDPWYEDLFDAYPYDPAKARELLAEAGYPDGLTLSLRVPTLPEATGATQYVVSRLREVGITANVEELEFPARWIDEVMTKSNYDLTIQRHSEGRDIVKFADPNYYWHYDNADFRKLIADADTATPENQVVLMKQAAQLLADDAAASFLWLFPNLIVAKAELTGIQPNDTSTSFDLTMIASRNS